MADEAPNSARQDETDDEKKRQSQLVERVIHSLENKPDDSGKLDIEVEPDDSYLSAEELAELEANWELSTVPASDDESSQIIVEQNIGKPVTQLLESIVIHNPREKSLAKSDTPPWTLQQFFDGEVDLDVELSKRFPALPVMSEIRFRNLGTRSGRRVATLTTQDNSATLIIEADTVSKVMQMSFTVGSMLTLRFAFSDLSDADREHWLELMQRREGGLAFLWGASRWAEDYVICITRPYFTNLYAFSPANFEASVRLTQPVLQKLLDWLETIWQETPDDNDEDAPLLTW